MRREFRTSVGGNNLVFKYVQNLPLALGCGGYAADAAALGPVAGDCCGGGCCCCDCCCCCCCCGGGGYALKLSIDAELEPGGD